MHQSQTSLRQSRVHALVKALLHGSLCQVTEFCQSVVCTMCAGHLGKVRAMDDQILWY